jgi:hypothetical protein
MHWQVVNTGCGDNDFFLVGAQRHFMARGGGRTAGTEGIDTLQSKLSEAFACVDARAQLYRRTRPAVVFSTGCRISDYYTVFVTKRHV